MLIMPPAVESKSVLVALEDPLFIESDGVLVETGVDVEVSGVVYAGFLNKSHAPIITTMAIKTRTMFFIILLMITVTLV